MHICIGIWFILQEGEASFIKLVDFICCWSFPLSFFVVFWSYIASSLLWAVEWSSSLLDCEITGWHEGDICCWVLKVWEPGGVVTLISLSDIAGLVVATRLVTIPLKVQFIVKLTSWYFRSRCPPDFALSLSLFQRHGYAFTWPIKHWRSFGLKLEDSWDTGEPSLGGSSLSISRENVWLVFFLL